MSGGLVCWFLRLRIRVERRAKAAVASEMRWWVMGAAADAVAAAAAVSRVVWRSWCVAAAVAAWRCESWGVLWWSLLLAAADAAAAAALEVASAAIAKC